MSDPFTHHLRRTVAGISVHAEILLDLCGRHDKPGCTFSDLKRMAINEKVGSPALLQKEIHVLLEKNLVAATGCKRDKRAKRLVVTAKGMRFLGRGE